MNQLLFIGNLGTGEIIIIAIIVLLLFGGKKIPELMKGIGKGVKNCDANLMLTMFTWNESLQKSGKKGKCSLILHNSL